MVKILLDHGARTRMKDGFGKTAFTWANEFGSPELFDLLLMEGG
ncbi:MAG: hypothetical protein VX399_06720 [SAR324 cluster bacterium]|nr:hypothetical protein [SAR324 cluster bacterium]